MPHRMLRQNFTRKRAILSHVQFYIFQHTPAKINSPPVPAQQKLHGLRVKKELKIKYKMVAFFPYE